MNGFLQTDQSPELRHQNATTALAFLKCTRWQEEELKDLTGCSYRYYCDSTYPGSYPPVVDLSAFLLTSTCYLLAMLFTVVHVTGGLEGLALRHRRWRCLSPSGPILLPFVLLMLSNGYRIDTSFPLSAMGPVLLQLVHISALAFETPVEKSVRYALLEASTASGVMHASLYLDSIILPYYTGLDALMRSTLSGDCSSCICREEALVVGGRVVAYRGWSATSLSVVGTLCSRLACGLFLEDRLSTMIKLAMEGAGWVLISRDCVYLMVGFRHGGVAEKVAHGAVCVLISLHLAKKVYSVLGFLEAFYHTQRKKELSHDIV